MGSVLKKYSPIIISDILLDSTHRFATRDFYDRRDNYYRGTLQDFPSISKELSDLYYGVEQGNTVTLRLANEGSLGEDRGPYVFESLQDFVADYVETDPNSRITVVADQITFTGLTENEDAWVYRDMGVGYFSKNFKIHLEVEITASTASTEQGILILANSLKSYHNIDTDNESYLGIVLFRDGGVNYNIYLDEVDSGARTTDNYVCATGTRYYLVVERKEEVGDYGTLYCYIYSDAEHTSLLDTLSITLSSSKKDFRYIYALNAHNDGVGANTMSGIVANVYMYREKTWDGLANVQELREKWVKIQRHDPTNTGHLITQDGDKYINETGLYYRIYQFEEELEFRGKVIDYTLDDVVEIVIEMRDDWILDTLLPLHVVTTDLFTDTAIDLGAVVNICFGKCRNVPLRNIQNKMSDEPLPTTTGTTADKLVDAAASFLTSTEAGEYVHRIVEGIVTIAKITNVDNDTTLSVDNDIFVDGDTYSIHAHDYLIGYSTLQGLWVDHANGLGIHRRDSRGWKLVTTTEYTFYDGSQAAPYPGYAFIRFKVEQRDFSGGMCELAADVYGLEMGTATAQRNFAYVIEKLLSDTSWGLSDDVDAVSFTAAAAALDAIGTMYCDGGVYEQRQARDILNELLFPARASVERGGDGEWEIDVDVASASVLNLGDNDNFYNNAEIGALTITPSNEALKNAIAHYDLNPLNEDKPFKEQTIAVHTTFGVDRTYELPFVLEDDTADKVLSYLKYRSLYSDRRVSVSAGMEARDLQRGDVVTLFNPDRLLTSNDFKIERIIKGGIGFTLECREYNVTIYNADALVAPTAPSSSDITVEGPRSWVGDAYVGDGTLTGSLRFRDGCDIILNPSDTDPALVKWSTVHNFGAATTVARGLCVWPTTPNQDYFFFGYDPVTPVISRYYHIVGYAYASITFDSTYDANNYARFSCKSYALGAPIGAVTISVKESGTVAGYEFRNTYFGPQPTYTLDLGTDTAFWGDVNYKTLDDRGCLGWFDEGVELQDGRRVTDLEAIKQIKMHPTKKTVFGLPMLDYRTLPKPVYRKAGLKCSEGWMYFRDENDEPWAVDPDGNKVKAEDGAELSSLVSVMLGAIRELDRKIGI